MKISIPILKTDIIRGKCGDPNKCAVARAALRALKPHGYSYVCVSPDYLRIGMDTISDRKSIPLPQKIVAFIEGFDDHKRKSLKPLSFAISL